VAFLSEKKKKNTGLNPTWTNFSKEFFYETKYADRLDKKKLVIECYDKDFMSADDFIGALWTTTEALTRN
jgi:hypothetical protein